MLIPICDSDRMIFFFFNKHAVYNSILNINATQYEINSITIEEALVMSIAEG